MAVIAWHVRSACGAIATAALLVGAPAAAQQPAAEAPAAETGPLDQARRLYLEADFEGARAGFVAALESPDLDVEAATEAHRYLAALALVVGDTASARRHAEAAFALRPAVEPPEGAPPELGALLDEVRGALGEAASLRIEAAEPGLEVGRPGNVEARLDPAPPALASRLRIRCRGAAVPEVSAEASPPSVEVVLSPTAGATAARCDAQAETDAGAALVRASVELSVRPAPEPVGGGGQDEGPRRPWWPWVVGGVGAAVVAAVVVAVVVTTAAPEPEDAFIGSPTVEGW